MDGLTHFDFSAAQAGCFLSYFLAGAKLLGTIGVFFIGKMMEKRPG